MKRENLLLSGKAMEICHLIFIKVFAHKDIIVYFTAMLKLNTDLISA